MTVLFWCVPIVYHMEAIPTEFRFWIEVNPLTAMVVVIRDVVVMGRSPGSDAVMHLAGFATVAVIGGIALFRRMERRFVEYL